MSAAASDLDAKILGSSSRCDTDGAGEVLAKTVSGFFASALGAEEGGFENGEALYVGCCFGDFSNSFWMRDPIPPRTGKITKTQMAANPKRASTALRDS